MVHKKIIVSCIVIICVLLASVFSHEILGNRSNQNTASPNPSYSRSPTTTPEHSSLPNPSQTPISTTATPAPSSYFSPSPTQVIPSPVTPIPTSTPKITPSIIISTPTLPAPTIVPTPPPLPVKTFGTVVQNYRTEEMDAFFPDMWTLLKEIGASHISCSARRWTADQAAENNIKCIFSFTAPPKNPETMEPYFRSSFALISHLEKYNISQYRDHPGVYGYILTGEPWQDYAFDPRNPDQATLDLIEVLKAGVEYIKSQDPTHPVTVQLNTTPDYFDDAARMFAHPDAYKNALEKRRAWISLFMDFCDFLMYNYYGHGTGYFDSAGVWRTTEWWKHPDNFRKALGNQLDLLIEEAEGKPVIIGECGCPSTPKNVNGNFLQFNEQNQADYYKIYGEEARARGIFVFTFKLIDNLTQPGWDYGLFNTENDGVRNIPKLVVPMLREYLSLQAP